MIQEKLDTEITAHAKTTEELQKQKEEVGQFEGIITALREAGQKKCQLYDEKIEIEVRLNNEMGRLEELPDKESKLW